MEKTELDFKDYTEEQLEGVLRFTASVANTNAELNEAVSQAKKYAKARNEKRSGMIVDEKIVDNNPEQNEIQAQVDNWLKRTKRK